MDISRIVSGASLYDTSAVSGLASAATQKSVDRLNRNVESTRVQLSAYGQVKSATAEVETAGKSLQKLAANSSFDDFRKAVQGLAAAVNNERAAVNRTTGAANSENATAGALSGDFRVRGAAGQIQRALQGNAGANEKALRQLGISVAQNGTVSVDSKKLEQAFAANPGQVSETLNNIGKGVAETATRQLSAGGNVGSGINRLNERLNGLQQSQFDYQSQLQAAQRQIDQRNQRVEQIQTQTQQAFGLNGVSAYKGVFSL